MAIFSGRSLVLWLGASALISASAAQPGGVDPSFDPGRGAEYVMPASGRSVLIQPDGKILVTGEFNAVNLDSAPAVLRFNPDGTLDGSFHVSIVPPAESGYRPGLLALQPNGQVLVGGTFANPDGTARYLTRLNSDGSLDTAFNPRIEITSGPPNISQAKVLSGGQILIGGWFTGINGVSRNSLARLNADGSLDVTFNAAVTSKGFVVQSTGKPVVVTGGNFTYSGDRLQRLNPDGSLDATFATVVPPSGYLVGGLLAEPDDKLIWTATQTGYYDWPGTIISRLTPDGANDPDFQPYSSVGGGPLLLQQDGRLIISGVYAGAKRLNPDGTPDSSFHPIALGSFAQQTDGKLIIAGSLDTKPYGIRRLFLDGSSDDSFAMEIGLTYIRRFSIDQACLLPNGKTVITGDFTYIDGIPRRKIAVLNSNGTLDGNFDAEDFLRAYWPGSSYDMVPTVQADGKILVAFDSYIVRLNPEGKIDTSFHYYPTGGYVDTLGLQPSGKILVSRFDALLRLNSDGSVDSAFHAEQPGGLVRVQPDAKILIRGTYDMFRLNAEGFRDPGFDAHEVRGFIPPALCGFQPDGKLLVSRFVSSVQQQALVRLNPNGAIDSTFNPAFPAATAAADLTGIYLVGNVAPSGGSAQLGVARLFFDGSRDQNYVAAVNSGAQISSLLIQPDGQLLVAGLFDHVNGVARAGIVRLNGAAPKKLANISTRVGVGRGQRVEIGGFIITGNAPKNVFIRALGPSLRSNGLIESQLLANPSLELHDSTGAVIAQNDDWRTGQEGEIMSSGMPPPDDAEAAIVKALAPGQYTAVIQGGDGGEGIALAEVYDLEPFSDSSLANISTRGFVNNNEGAMIAGLILRGAETATIVARAMGPSLLSSGVTDALADPTLELHDSDGAILETNDNWKANEAAIRATGLAPDNDLESALVRTLAPGAYTAIVRGKSNTAGIGLVEIYSLP